ncbi:flagellar hook protein FlgE [Legionella birminghamensis]|uniref:Flagellar hook protein FlgE n=1 Tax=Legionella birminghamensis TaxID=28083 RepID=A0A378I859_9GAMM|nr:flagellar hook-basal body complex protein [Legionella birminghamensis]KTC68311.1 flagellar hook protein FlgE [Legionella birminghamensis]STX30976.1 flagellar hook protein FlgE [Legionella birminghamensis]
MSNTYYTSMSGMMAASYGLQNTSHNISNMQSPGFKRSDVFYSSLGNDHGQHSTGLGVSVKGQHTNFKPGTYVGTGNPADLAIEGNGFFIVRLQNGELLYTRDGEFGFNQEGLLADKHSKGLVMGYNKHQQLVPIQEKGPLKCPGKATSVLSLKGNLVGVPIKDSQVPTPDMPDTGEKQQLEPIKFNVGSVYDDKGKAHQISIELEAEHANSTYDEGRGWLVKNISCYDADIQFDPQQIEFDSNLGGRGKAGSNEIRFLLNGTQMVCLQLGDRDSNAENSVQFDKKSATNPMTNIETYKQDGYGEGRQIDFSFDDNGQIYYSYDNGQKLQGMHLALANFDDMENTLSQTEDNLFRVKNDRFRHIGLANKEGLGRIQTKSLEQSNVDATTEFAHIVVLQRMFQACSQIMDIDKQLLEEFYRK